MISIRSIFIACTIFFFQVCQNNRTFCINLLATASNVCLPSVKTATSTSSVQFFRSNSSKKSFKIFSPLLVASGQDILIYLSPGQNKIIHSWIVS
ncbi:uncharacterized protein LOC118507436 [Anopheles stephensi]|uniref:uncharacterized protein LOC118507436 n=1 Tax=Anopheles stephensi TaxID=30069 RepID=UPI001658917B|nr:uncharacterized protein LOC118507436 [Anopheles stephensi]